MRSVPRLESVVVADDLTDGSVVAFQRAASLPLASRAELHLVHVVDARLAADMAQRAMGAARRALQERAAAATALVRTVSPASEVSVATHVRHGTAFVEIIRQARALGAGLIVLGRHRRRRIRDAIIGATAERIVRKGNVPVLLAAGEHTGPYRRVLAAVDLGDASRSVVELAASLAPSGCGLTLVHAYDVAFEATLGAATLADALRLREQEATVAGETLRELMAPLGVVCRLVLRRGDPPVTLLREAARERADLLVAGTHARSGVAHALLGSVAEWLVRAAPCDVAVTRPARFTFELP